MNQYIIDLLLGLEQILPPPECAHHALIVARYGTTVQDSEPRPAIVLRLNSGKSKTLFFEDGDFDKPVDRLIAEIVFEVHKSEFGIGGIMSNRAYIVGE